MSKSLTPYEITFAVAIFSQIVSSGSTSLTCPPLSFPPPPHPRSSNKANIYDDGSPLSQGGRGEGGATC